MTNRYLTFPSPKSRCATNTHNVYGDPVLQISSILPRARFLLKTLLMTYMSLGEFLYDGEGLYIIFNVKSTGILNQSFISSRIIPGILENKLLYRWSSFLNKRCCSSFRFRLTSIPLQLSFIAATLIPSDKLYLCTS